MNGQIGHTLHVDSRTIIGLCFLAILLWVGFLVVAVLADIIQRVLIAPTYGTYNGELASAFVLCAFLAATSWFSLVRRHIYATRIQLLAVGILWVVLTLAFEVGFRHFISDRFVMKLLVGVVMDESNIFGGRFWMALLIIQLITPLFLKLAWDAFSGKRFKHGENSQWIEDEH